MGRFKAIKKPQARFRALRLACFANKPDYRATDALIPLPVAIKPTMRRMVGIIQELSIERVSYRTSGFAGNAADKVWRER